ncbi:hypothetical protein F511_37946 [Dorcoceras hygrometricum]|uniref:Uncharacterized protein n=1 Tax=Dorcoceras hygrometricum TaxID=472368 RepID=A0A2Z7AJX0_9LAMI|nr:hypothetical protein F511_37946 [Dorcoceras hygrometricum]
MTFCGTLSTTAHHEISSHETRVKPAPSWLPHNLAYSLHSQLYVDTQLTMSSLSQSRKQSLDLHNIQEPIRKMLRASTPQGRQLHLLLKLPVPVSTISRDNLTHMGMSTNRLYTAQTSKARTCGYSPEKSSACSLQPSLSTDPAEVPSAEDEKEDADPVKHHRKNPAATAGDTKKKSQQLEIQQQEHSTAGDAKHTEATQQLKIRSSQAQLNSWRHVARKTTPQLEVQTEEVNEVQDTITLLHIRECGSYPLRLITAQSRAWELPTPSHHGIIKRAGVTHSISGLLNNKIPDTRRLATIESQDKHELTIARG